jgi:hypothetical protein
VVDPHVVAVAVQMLIGQVGPVLAPLFKQGDFVPLSRLVPEALLAHLAHGQHHVGWPATTLTSQKAQRLENPRILMLSNFQ